MSALAAPVLEGVVVEDALQAEVLTPERARRLTRQLRKALSLALDLLVEVFEGRAWEVLTDPSGQPYSSWEAYCTAELPELAHLRLSVPQRRDAVSTQRGRGMSTRAIATPLGLSVGTVHRDLQAAGVHLATVTSLDGRHRPAAAAAAPVPAPAVVVIERKTDRTLALVAAAGPDGMTVHELCRRTGWHHGQASAALTRLAQRGRLVASATRREACAAYVLPALLDPAGSVRHSIGAR